jgi:hypothetical protein
MKWGSGVIEDRVPEPPERAENATFAMDRGLPVIRRKRACRPRPEFRGKPLFSVKQRMGKSAGEVPASSTKEETEMIQALMGLARAIPSVLKAAGPAMGRIGATVGKAAPELEKGAAGLAKGAGNLPRGANAIEKAPKPGGSGPMDFLNTAMDVVGMGSMVKDLIPQKKPEAPAQGPQNPKGA